MTILPRDFYERDPVEVARDLIGKHLVRRISQGVCCGIIVETEAYLAANDSASHSFRGMNRKNKTMFGRAGLLYVYPIHSRYCLNAVTERKSIASAVLIRAVMPTAGIEFMQQRRSLMGRVSTLLDLARGPARLCEAFDVNRRLDGWDLTRGSRIWIEEAPLDEDRKWEIAAAPRIGVTSAHDLDLRFFVKGCAFVSGRKSFAT